MTLEEKIDKSVDISVWGSIHNYVYKPCSDNPYVRTHVYNSVWNSINATIRDSINKKLYSYDFKRKN